MAWESSWLWWNQPRHVVLFTCGTAGRRLHVSAGVLGVPDTSRVRTQRRSWILSLPFRGVANRWLGKVSASLRDQGGAFHILTNGRPLGAVRRILLVIGADQIASAGGFLKCDFLGGCSTISCWYSAGCTTPALVQLEQGSNIACILSLL